MDDGDPPFPRPAGYWWFGCEEQSQPLREEPSQLGIDVSSEILDAGEDEMIRKRSNWLIESNGELITRCLMDNMAPSDQSLSQYLEPILIMV